MYWRTLRRSRFFSSCAAAASFSMPWVPDVSTSASFILEPGFTRRTFESCAIRASFYTGEMLILASQAPRRSEILRQAGIPFTVRAADVDESVLGGESPADYVQRLAEAKAYAIEAADGETVLGADTTVVIDGEILAKPPDAADARRMLARLSGRRHEVLTGICLRRGGHTIVECATTGVVFAALSDAEIDEYVASGEPMDKAGAYAIQGLASKFVERVEGEYFNVMGLPVALVYRLLTGLPQGRLSFDAEARRRGEHP